MLEAPENTEKSLKYVAENKGWWMETDVHKTKDGIFICCHDKELLRITG